MAAPIGSRDFGSNLLAMVASVVPLTGSCFYRVDDEAITHDALSGLSEQWLREYDRLYWRFDPLHPVRMPRPELRIATLSKRSIGQDPHERSYFYRFLVPQHTVHQTEIYFRAHGKVIAGASLLRSEQLGEIAPEQLAYLGSLIDFVDGILSVDTLAGDLDAYRLTAREKDIVRLIGQGSCNKDICRALDIRLPTVKTHIARVFEKTGAHSRTELVNRLFHGGALSAAGRDPTRNCHTSG